MKGKEKCRILKEIRAEIAKQNDIEWVTKECEHKGECKGTCPRCEAEVRKLERELELKKRLGQSVAVVGVASVLAIASTGCAIDDVVEVIQDKLGLDDDYGYAGGLEPIELSGDVDYDPYCIETIPETETGTESEAETKNWYDSYTIPETTHSNHDISSGAEQ